VKKSFQFKKKPTVKHPDDAESMEKYVEKKNQKKRKQAGY